MVHSQQGQNKLILLMKLFFSKGFLFLAILGLYFLVNYYLNTFFIAHYPPRLKAKTLIMGDSHPMTCIDPSFFKNARNISRPNEPYAATYFKLLYLLKHHQIDTLILGFSPHNISDVNDKKFMDDLWSGNMFKMLYPITSLKNYANHEINKTNYVLVLFKHMLLFPTKNHHRYLGNFLGRKGILKRNNSNPIDRIKTHYFYNNKDSKISTLSLSYLDSIIKISNEHKLKVILVNSPLHSMYNDLIPSTFKDEYKMHQERLKEKDVIIFDFSDYIHSDEYFADIDHVNIKGAKLISLQLKNSLAQMRSLQLKK